MDINKLEKKDYYKTIYKRVQASELPDSITLKTSDNKNILIEKGSYIIYENGGYYFVSNLNFDRNFKEIKEYKETENNEEIEERKESLLLCE